MLIEFDGFGIDIKWFLIKNEEYWDKEIVKLDKVVINVVKEVLIVLNFYEIGEVDDMYLFGELV